MSAVIQVGASGETIKNAKAAILEIVKASCGDKVKIAALAAFKEAVAVNYTTIESCSFTTGDVK